MTDALAGSLAGTLKCRAASNPFGTAYVYLADGVEEQAVWTWRDVDRRARAVAAALAARLQPGDRALLLYPPGPDFVAGFFGCLYAGVIAVPAYPPRSPRTLPRLLSILADSQPAVALSISTATARVKGWLDKEGAALPWLATDELADAAWGGEEPAPDAVAFLQYTSGSTATPKGVMVTHANLAHNQEVIRGACAHSEESVFVSWLPVYHDLGLIGQVLQAAWVGAPCVLMPPVAFLQNPLRWLAAVSRYRATTSGAPNFAWELASRRISAADRARLDLSSWRVAFNGAEPVRAETLERFAATFAECGFRAEAAYPCYGLAEATLMVTGGRAGAGPVVRRFGAGERAQVGCGAVLADLEVVVVEPVSGEAAQGVGEVWIAGGSVAKGYWKRPQETAETFCAFTADGRGPYLRTGDLGFFAEGELYIAGRLKDLIILRGRNCYPQDIERTAAESHPALEGGMGAAFAVDEEGEERLVVVHEVGRHAPAAGEIAEAVRQAVAAEHEAAVWDVVLVPQGGVPRTTSGKVQRRACRELYLADDLKAVGRSRLTRAAAELALEGSEDLEARLRRLVGAAARVAPEHLDRARPLTAYGLDSLGAVELAHAVEAATGVELGIADLLSGMTLAEVEAKVAEGAAAKPSEPVPPAVEHPMSWGQRSLWYLHRLAPESAAYTIAGAARVLSETDGEALQSAWRRLVERHSLLRATFSGGCAHLDGPRPELRRIAGPVGLDELAFAPFDLAAGPIARAALVENGEEKLFLLSLHHVAADFWSVSILLGELGALLAGGELPPVAARYADYVRWQEEMLGSDRGEALWRHWQARLAGAPPLDLPTDRPRPPVQSFRGVTVSSRLDGALDELAHRHAATPFAVLMAATQLLLARLSGQDDLVVGTPALGRPSARFAGVVGYFANLLALRAGLAPETKVGDWLAAARDGVLDALAHQDFPFALLTERLEPDRDPSRPPLVQAMLTWLAPGEHPYGAAAVGVAGTRLTFGALELETLPLASPAAQLDLALAAAPVEGGLAVSLAVNADLFDRETAERWLAHLGNLLEGLAGDPAARVRELPLLSENERGAVVYAWPSSLPLLRTAGLAGPFLAQAERTPDAVALRHESESLTYRELAARAAGLARRLAGLGVGHEDLVAVYCERTPELIVGLLGTLAAGGVYVPLDPNYPRARIEALLADSGARVLLTERALAGSLPPFSGPIVLLDEGPSPLGPLSLGERGSYPAIDPDQAAYIIYTSGSTGRPKGVVIRHGSALARVAWAGAVYPEELRAVVLGSTSVCFDLSVFEIFVPLSLGGTLVLADDALAFPDAPAAGEVVLVNTVPSAATELVQGGWMPEGVRVVNLAGEPLRRSLADGLYGLPHVREVWNLYGPSEDTTYSTGVLVPRESRSEPTIGRPLAGTRAYVVDRGGQLSPPGVPGELWLAGDGLSRGYLGRPELTAERYRPDPFAGEPGERVYTTGDLVRRSVDGELSFLGRIDHQVKVRGFRIELGEIEIALAAHPDVAECVVVARGEGGDRQLVAYVAAAEGRPVEPAGLRAHLKETLPEHMVPTAWVALAALPRTPNGKIDRRALPEPGAGAVEKSAPPRTATEQALAAVWSELLQSEEIGRGDDFFARGGHSLLAARLVSRLAEPFGVELAVSAVLQHPKLADLAAVIDRERGLGGEGIPPIGPVDRLTEIPLSRGQERLWFLDRLAPGKAVYNLPGAVELSGPLDVGALRRALSEIVRRHEALRTVFVEIDGRPVQWIETPLPFDLPLVEEADEQAFAAEPFDLATGPLVRGLLVRRGPDRHALLVCFHHTVADGWSLPLFLDELAALYEGRELPEPPVQYADYAVWERGLEEAPLDGWRERLVPPPPPLELPTDRPRPAAETFRGAVLRETVPPALLDALRNVARGQGATSYMAWLAGFAAQLGRWSGQARFAVASPVANRSRPELEGLIGYFVNTLPLPLDLSGRPTFAELLGRVREVVLGALAHQQVPFDRLVEAFAGERDLSRAPLAQAMLAFREARPAVSFGGLAVELLPLHTGTAKLDLTLSFDGRTAELEFNTDLFDEATARRFLGELLALLQSAFSDPNQPLFEAPLKEQRPSLMSLPSLPSLPPRGPIEEIVAGIWEDVLSRPAVGRNQSFFELGGHSLLASRVTARLRKAFDVELPVRTLFERPTVAELAELLAGRPAEGAAPLLPRERPAQLPLAPAQERLWFLEELAPGTPVYSIPVAFRLRGALDRSALARAFAALARRHESLRTTFQEVEGRPVQKIAETGFPLTTIELAEPEALRFVEQEARRPFDLAAGPLAKAFLVSLAPQDHLLLVVLHHLIADGWSLGVLWREIAALYGGEELAPLAVQYADYALWRRELPVSGQLARWRELLAEAPPSLELPTDRPRPEEQSFRGDAVACTFPAGDLRNLVRRERATLFMGLLAGFSALLHRVSGQDDLVVGTPVDGRRVPEVEGLIGLFVNTLPLRVRFAPDTTFAGLLAQVRATALAAYEAQDVPFARLVEAFAPRRHLARSPLFQVLLAFEDGPAPRPALPGVGAEPVAVHTGTAKFDLTLALAAQGDEVAGGLEFDRDLFARPTVERWLRDLATLLEKAVRDPSRPIVDLPRLAASESKQVAAVEPAVSPYVAPRNAIEELLVPLWCEVLGVTSVGVLDDFFTLGGQSILGVRLLARVRGELGVRLPVRQLFKRPTIAAMAELIAQELAVQAGDLLAEEAADE